MFWELNNCPYTAKLLTALYAVFFDIIVEGDALKVIKDVNSSPFFFSLEWTSH
jgi:hypothetical protein